MLKDRAHSATPARYRWEGGSSLKGSLSNYESIILCPVDRSRIFVLCQPLKKSVLNHCIFLLKNFGFILVKNVHKCPYLNRKADLRELKILQKIENKQYQDLLFKAQFNREQQERKFEAEMTVSTSRSLTVNHLTKQNSFLPSIAVDG